MQNSRISCVSDEGPISADGQLARVVATDAARALIADIKSDHGDILFHQSGGCCDGSSPMCYPKDDFLIGQTDVKLGEVEKAEVWISGPQFEVWKHTQLILDVVPGRGGMFSLDNGRERRFLARSRLFTPEELDALDSKE
ncbi:DUF779 domain-containing protein [Sulfitobacter sp. S190]|uniref:DUF779 domain-containing protein n=1 Tax=Sulfitobacter sp. S190 TaxID=2867022 RepID=UPI0021A5253C|nr:DUF779 domain-containing protein [Sulfitobacter sp. S190]UWR24594.1 DUF779 domain-containing protein [Sulfitobacter sp. S190]